MTGMRPLTREIAHWLRPESLLLGAGAVLAGLAASVLRGGVVLMPAVMTLLCTIFFQLAANIYYGYLSGSAIAKKSGEPVEERYLVMRTISNVFAILSVTCAFPIFTHIRWYAILYIALILATLHFYLSGRKPLINTPWAPAVTFILFGPLAVSGTALVQNMASPDWLPIVVYTLISGMLAVNVRLSMTLIHLRDEVRTNAKRAVSRQRATIAVYVFNIVVVCLLMVAFPYNLGFGGRLYGIVIPLWLLSTAAIAFRWMRDPYACNASKVRKTVFIQYVTAMLVLLCMVLISTESYWVTFFSLYN